MEKSRKVGPMNYFENAATGKKIMTKKQIHSLPTYLLDFRVLTGSTF